MQRRRLAFLLIAVSVFSLRVTAQSTPASIHLHLDPATTEVHFALKSTLHTVHGSFHMDSGEITVAPSTGEAQGRIAININSGISGNETRDNRMKREILEATSFPVAAFEARKVRGLNTTASTQTITVEGTLTLHGTAHPMTLQLAVTLNGVRASATGSFRIPYVAWGIKAPSVPFIHVEKEVTVDLIAKGTLQIQ